MTLGINSQGQVGKERKREESESNTSAICLDGVHMCTNISHGIHMLFFFSFNIVDVARD